MFVDADDWLPLDAVETLIRKQRDTNADYVSGNIIQVQLFKSRLVYLYDEISFNKSDSQLFDRFFTSNRTAYAPWGHLYKSKIISDAGLKFKTDMLCGEDALFNYQYLQHCKSIAVTDKAVYYYNRINSDSITKNFRPCRNKEEILWLGERRKLYTTKLTPDQRLKEDDQLLYVFSTLCQDYIFFLPKDIAIEKMKETHKMYSDLLQQTGEYGAGTGFEAIESYLAYRRYLDSCDYEGLYNYFHEKSNYRQAERRFPLVRKILLRIRMFQLFRLKIGCR